MLFFFSWLLIHICMFSLFLWQKKRKKREESKVSSSSSSSSRIRMGRERGEAQLSLSRVGLRRVSHHFTRVGVVNKIYHNLFFSFSAFLSFLSLSLDLLARRCLLPLHLWRSAFVGSHTNFFCSVYILSSRAALACSSLTQHLVGSQKCFLLNSEDETCFFLFFYISSLSLSCSLVWGLLWWAGRAIDDDFVS